LVRYGTDPGTLAGTVSVGTPVLQHQVTLTGLAANTTYFFRVVSVDFANNSSTSPDPVTMPPASFVTPDTTFKDTLVADFNAGTPGTGTSVVPLADGAGAPAGDGAVTLAGGFGSNFDGPGLPPDWSSCVWGGKDRK